MGRTEQILPARRGQRLYVELAADQPDLRAAQTLRYQVFGREMGAKLKGGEVGLDVDDFDPYCQHLLVRESATNRVVGCTRILTDDNARRAGRFYSEGELELGAIKALPGRMLEVGRTCIAPEYRQGAGIAVLWSGLAAFTELHGFDYLFGCASLPLGDQDIQAAAIMNRLRRGGRLVIFPEGTTTDGTRLQRFHPRLLAAGQLGGILVQPVALRYGAREEPDQVAPFLGDEALLPHLARLVRHPGLRVEIHFLPPLDGSELSRRSIAEHCRESIESALGLDSAVAPPAPVEPRGAATPAVPETRLVEAA